MSPCAYRGTVSSGEAYVETLYTLWNVDAHSRLFWSRPHQFRLREKSSPARIQSVQIDLATKQDFRCPPSECFVLLREPLPGGTTHRNWLPQRPATAPLPFGALFYMFLPPSDIEVGFTSIKNLDTMSSRRSEWFYISKDVASAFAHRM
jgi:hypothetical protein